MKNSSIATILLSVVFFSPASSAGSQPYEFAAGDVTLPFAYSAAVSAAPRPAVLDFKQERGSPDNCQVFVRMDGELWEFKMQILNLPLANPARYKGPDIDHMVRQKEDSGMPAGYLAWFLGGMWYDESGKKLYAPMHVEFLGIHRDRPIAPWPSRKIILATSTDKGKTWHDEGDIITPETYFYIPDTYKFSGSDYSNGLCDFGFYADVRGGYFYIFPLESWLTKGTWYCRWSARAARCAISDKMAPGKWKFFYNGNWDQPALGGKSSIIAPGMWDVIYSDYLKKYVCLFPSSGGSWSPEETDGVYMGFCSDLSKQDWQWVRCPEAQYGFINVLNGDGTDLTSCSQTLRYYSYNNGNTFQRLDVTFKEGQTTGTSVQPRYSFEAHPESSDPILSRQTKFIGSASAEVTYDGAWTDRDNPSSYEGHLKECASSGSATLSFTGSAIYWRALRSPDSGRADVYIDGKLRKTVDCYSPQSTDYEQIVYILTGLSPGVKHTIKIVVRGEKHVGSKGTAIRHIGFEYAAESYKASAGFSSLMGKNNWLYEEWDGATHHAMHFCENVLAITNYWFGKSNQIGPNYQSVLAGNGTPEAAVRVWMAPHDGAVRIEGQVSISNAPTDNVAADIFLNGTELWPPRVLVAGMPESHDLTVAVHQGDRVCFVVKTGITENRTDVSGDKVTWDPVVTYTQSSSPVWKPNPPGDENLALGKYARSKRLFGSYRPFDAVDGSADSFFALSDADKITSGNDDWLMVDLDRTTRVDRYVVLSTPQNAAWRPSVFKLQKSDDEFSWTDIDSVEKNSSDRVERPVPAFKARYVRIYLPHGRPFCINEFELYFTDGKPLKEVGH